MEIPTPSAALALNTLPAATKGGASSEEVSKDFEKVFLTQFVDQMLKTVGPTAFGGEKQADMWRSFLSEAIAGSLTEQGGFGIGTTVADVVAAYDKGRQDGAK